MVGWEQYDVLINFAYDDFEQTKILELPTTHGKMTLAVNTLLTFLQGYQLQIQTYLKDIFTPPKRH